jgi:hypothetical protein
MSAIANATSGGQPSYAAAVSSTELTKSTLGSSDALGQMLAAMESLAQGSLSLSQMRARHTKDQIEERLAEFLEKLREACTPKSHHGGGLFGSIFGALGDAFGAVIGTLADFLVDVVTMPIDVTKDVVNNWGNPSAMLSAIAASQSELVKNGATAEDVRGFCEGVARFSGDFLEFTHKYGIDWAAGIVTGNLEPSGEDAARLWGSLKENVIDNPHFWAVMSAAAKVTSIAATLMSGGAMAWLAVGLFVALEADSHLGVSTKVFGEKAAPWVRLGLGVAASGACLFGGAGGNVMASIRVAAGITSGASAIGEGYHVIADGNARADEMEREASLQGTLNQMQRLQRLLDAVIAGLDRDNKDNEKTRQLGTTLVQLDTQTQAAAVIRA